ncbi:MAG: DUF3052 domain-containing protein [Jatrophihabitans sp.]|uniref:DUF3052 domain-containing protein n=1 Tax=Jatrophihabitans sp. TaxID=1932789 RepID=UPI00391601B0
MLQWGMAGASPGYSGSPQIRKLGIKPGSRVAVEGAPAGWSLDAPPPVVEAGDGPADLLLRFVRSAAELADVPDLGQRIFPDGALWIAWPRRAGGHVSDVTDTVIREAVLPLGLVDVKVAAIDADWSGLKIVWRTERRTPS